MRFKFFIVLALVCLLALTSVTAYATTPAGKVEVTNNVSSEVYTLDCSDIIAIWDNGTTATLYIPTLRGVNSDFSGGYFVCDDTYDNVVAAMVTATSDSVTNVTATGTIQAEQLTTTDDLTVTGLATVGETLGVTGALTGTTGSFATSVGHTVETGGASCLLTSISEETTIPVGSGADPVVTTTGDLAPEGVIVEVIWKVIDAPGGGATTLDIGITGGDLDGLTDGASCDVLNEEGSMHVNKGASFAAETLYNASATTLTLTTDGDVTGDEMIVEITVFYWATTAPPDGS